VYVVCSSEVPACIATPAPQFAATADDEILVALGSQGGSQPRLDPALLLTETQDIRAALAGRGGGYGPICKLDLNCDCDIG
jgi:hypothetical protein